MSEFKTKNQVIMQLLNNAYNPFSERKSVCFASLAGSNGVSIDKECFAGWDGHSGDVVYPVPSPLMTKNASTRTNPLHS